MLLSNSPRPSPGVQEQLRRLGVPDDAYDATVTSGDLTRHELAKHKGAEVFHLGPERDLPIFDGLEVELVAPEDAELVVCSGLFDDETETPEDYDGLLSELAARKLPMICANPDHLVERGDRLVYCAGALAAIYERAGRQRALCRQAPCADLCCWRSRPSLPWQARASPRTKSLPSATGSIPTLLARLALASMPCSWRAGCMCRQTAAGTRARTRSMACTLPNCSLTQPAPARRHAYACLVSLVFAQQLVDAGLACTGMARPFEWASSTCACGLAVSTRRPRPAPSCAWR